jgi:dTDP-4-dehydrorhamnose reductase
MTGAGDATWASFAEAIFERAAQHGRPHVSVKHITTADYPTPARRPPYGVLDTRRFEATFGFALRPWRTALEDCLASPAEPSPSGDRHSGSL